jgi:hypothetical protein
MRKRFYLEIQTSGDEVSGFEDRYNWLNYDTIVAEGNTLEECLEDATVFTMDQDGGEGPQIEGDADWVQELVVDAFITKLLKQKVG